MFVSKFLLSATVGKVIGRPLALQSTQLTAAQQYGFGFYFFYRQWFVITFVQFEPTLDPKTEEYYTVL